MTATEQSLDPFHGVQFEFPDLFGNFELGSRFYRFIRNLVLLLLKKFRPAFTRLRQRASESWAETQEIHRRMREVKDAHAQHFNFFYLR